MLTFLAYRAHKTLEKHCLFNCVGGPRDIAHIIRCYKNKEIEREMEALGFEIKNNGPETKNRLALEWKFKENESESRDSEPEANDDGPEMKDSEPIRNRHLTVWDSFDPAEVMNLTEKNYGKQFSRPRQHEFLSEVETRKFKAIQAIRLNLLRRQDDTMKLLNAFIYVFLNIHCSPPTTIKDVSEESARTALPNIPIVEKPGRVWAIDLLNNASNIKFCYDDFLDLCCTNPVFLSWAVGDWYMHRPELVPDQKGRWVGSFSDKCNGIAMYEMLHNALTAVATLEYLCKVLQLLIDCSERVPRHILLQEISNVCNHEYERVQRLFKHYVQMQSGAKNFQRISDVYDSGVARVLLKIKPEALTIQNPQFHYMLRLCQPENIPSKATTWISKLNSLHESNPEDTSKIGEMELVSLGNLSSMVGFVNTLSASLKHPPINSKKGQGFIARLSDLANELDPLKTKVDLRDFMTPIEFLKESGNSGKALAALD